MITGLLMFHIKDAESLICGAEDYEEKNYLRTIYDLSKDIMIFKTTSIFLIVIQITVVGKPIFKIFYTRFKRYSLKVFDICIKYSIGI